MKGFFTLLLVVCFSAAIAQNECPSTRTASTIPCSTLMKWDENNADNFRSYFAKVNPEILYQRGNIQWVPIQYHIITRDDGSCGADLRKVLETHCEMNGVFNEFGMGFYISGIDTIRDTYIWTMDNQAIADITYVQYNDTNALNVYVNANLPGACGFASLPQYDPRGGGVFMHKDCIGHGDKTLHHEVGHYFSLIHTFETALGVERVNGSNCSVAGDLMCDTPADFPDHWGSCPFMTNATDSNGDTYHPDPTIFMSYFENRCKTRFTSLQRAAMITTLNGVRNYLLRYTPPDVTPLGDPVFLQPNSSTYVNSNSITFRWNKVDRAILYRFILTTATSKEIVLDTLMQDTSILVNSVLASKSYRYIVKPLSYGNVCAEQATWHEFETSPIKAIVQVVSPNCYSVINDTVVVTPWGGRAPYTFRWSDGSTDSLLLHLPGGDYTLTVTDYNKATMIEHISVVLPPQFSAGIHATPNNLVATGTGGTPPYTYHWNNNVNNRFNNFPQYGNYSVTITDSKGCEAVADIVYASLGSISSKLLMRIYPNPAYQSSVLNVQLELPGHMEGIVSLMNVNGEVIQEQRKDFIGGANSLQLNVGALPSGVYFVKFCSANAIKTERFSLVR